MLGSLNGNAKTKRHPAPNSSKALSTRPTSLMKEAL